MSQKSLHCLLQWHLVTHLSVWGHSHLWMPAVPDRLRLKAHSSSVSLTSVCGLSACYYVVWIKMMYSQSEAPARCPFFHPVYLHTVMCDASRHDAVGLSMSCYRSSDCVYPDSSTLTKWNPRITRPYLNRLHTSCQFFFYSTLKWNCYLALWDLTETSLYIQVQFRILNLYSIFPLTYWPLTLFICLFLCLFIWNSAVFVKKKNIIHYILLAFKSLESVGFLFFCL